MRFLILNTDYPEFLRDFYSARPGLETRPFEEQLRARMQTLYSVADFYSSNLRALGHQAFDVHINNPHLQTAWAREHGLSGVEWERAPLKGAIHRMRRLAARTPLRVLKGLLRPATRTLDRPPDAFFRILAAQVEHHRPDVLLNHAMDGVPPEFVRDLKRHARLVVGQHTATPLPEDPDWSAYDLVISSFPPTVDWFRARGVPAELHRLGFEPSVLERVRESRSIAASFVGSFFDIHSSRVRLLERLCAEFDLRVWGPSVDRLGRRSPLRRAYQGRAWGLDMYQILAQSRITLNHHGDVPPFANNLRLYEATGMGTTLLTDWKPNLGEMFEVGTEVAAYRSEDECVQLLRRFLDRPEEAEEIGRAGQRRTLRDHTYRRRMQELVAMVGGRRE